MGCWGGREKFDNPDNEQKWDYINLSDFRSTSCVQPLSYGILYIFLIISVAVYAVDIFTCANLLFFDKWSGQVKPVIPFEISRWIFTGCIILSWVLLVFRWWRAIRAMKSGVVAASYLDPLAVRVQSIRMGANGRGWRRFLVFTALTKGRKGAEYVALFTYFSFEAWLRICFAEGPRQVINAITLYSVMQANLVPAGENAAKDGHTPVVQFFVNVQILANEKKEQAAILFGMLFTLVIWTFTALSLVMAVIFYITFLWHHVRDGSLSRYCRRKIDSRLHKIVMVKVNKALAKDNKTLTKQEGANMKAEIPQGDLKRQPKLPILDSERPPGTTSLSRQTTQTDTSSLEYQPLPRALNGNMDGFRRAPTVPNVFSNPQRPQSPSRSITQDSTQSTGSFADDTPLIRSAAPFGYNARGSRDPPMRTESANMFDRYKPLGQSFTSTTQGSQRSYGSSSLSTGLPARQNTDISGRSIPAAGLPPIQVRKPMPQNMTSDHRARTPGLPASGMRRDATQEYEMQFQLPKPRMNGPSPNNGRYVAFNPSSLNNGHGATPSSSQAHPFGSPQGRNLTQPQNPPTMNYFGNNQGPQRSGTAPLTGSYSHNAAVDAYGGSWQQPRNGPVPCRPATAGPGIGRQMPPR